MWQYVQDSGEMCYASGTLLARGYSGKAPYKNDPSAQCRANEGPIPRGTYTIGSETDSKGPVTLPLTPAPSNAMCGRSAFLIHGDSIANPGTASEGCIILPRHARETIRDSGDRQLVVVETRAGLELIPIGMASIAEGTAVTTHFLSAPSLSEHQLHPDAEALILDFEGLNQPGKWPGGDSGVTIGYGYDLGYCTVDQFESDWSSHLGHDVLGRLRAVIGVRGQRARDLSLSLRDIAVSAAPSLLVFRQTMVPDAWAKTRRAFPGVEGLVARAAGALTSLVLNRGGSLHDEPGQDRRREIREIRATCAVAGMPKDAQLRTIAASLRSMKRLWEGAGLQGLIRRREAEALLVERGIADLPPPSAAAKRKSAPSAKTKCNKRPSRNGRTR